MVLAGDKLKSVILTQRFDVHQYQNFELWAPRISF